MIIFRTHDTTRKMTVHQIKVLNLHMCKSNHIIEPDLVGPYRRMTGTWKICDDLKLE